MSTHAKSGLILVGNQTLRGACVSALFLSQSREIPDSEESEQECGKRLPGPPAAGLLSP